MRRLLPGQLPTRRPIHKLWLRRLPNRLFPAVDKTNILRSVYDRPVCQRERHPYVHHVGNLPKRHGSTQRINLQGRLVRVLPRRMVSAKGKSCGGLQLMDTLSQLHERRCLGRWKPCIRPIMRWQTPAASPYTSIPQFILSLALRAQRQRIRGKRKWRQP